MGMDYLDKDILESRKMIRKSKYNTLQTGIYINDEVVQFTAAKILDERAEVMLPDTFVDMPANLARLKYMSEQRPQIIKTSLDTTINFTFSLYGIELQEEEIDSTIHQFKNLIQKVNPACVFDEIVAEKDRGGICHNIMYVKPIGGKLLHGVFNCMYRDIAEWKSAALQVIYSVRDLTEEG